MSGGTYDLKAELDKVRHNQAILARGLIAVLAEQDAGKFTPHVRATVRELDEIVLRNEAEVPNNADGQEPATAEPGHFAKAAGTPTTGPKSHRKVSLAQADEADEWYDDEGGGMPNDEGDK